MELSSFRRAVELRLSSGDEALRTLRAGQTGTPGNRRRWAGRHEGLVRRLRIRRGRTKNTNAFFRERRAETHRSVVSRSAVSAACSTQLKPERNTGTLANCRDTRKSTEGGRWTPNWELTADRPIGVAQRPR